MASRIEENELIYNKKVNADKEFKKKDALWESKTARMEKDATILKIWYGSIQSATPPPYAL